MKNKRIVSGIQPTGDIHLGNYLGAIRNWVKYQQEYESFFFIADLHAITVPQDPQQLNIKIKETAAILIAAGIDAVASPVFIQSRVSAHSELAWILSCNIPMGWMRRMTQFKDKSSNKKDTVSAALFDYPALMAADILLYDADFVPVGDDQKQHLELTKNVAKRFNSIYGKTFTIPEPLISESGARIMGLNDPAKKMSKTGGTQNNAIHILDPADEIYSKIMGAKTDSFSEIQFDKPSPGVRNLLMIYRLFSGLSDAKIKTRFSGKGYAVLKKELAEFIIEQLKPIQKKFKEIAEDMASLDAILNGSALKVLPMADKKLKMVKDRIGLGENLRNKEKKDFSHLRSST